jgi:hypothetical protein
MITYERPLFLYRTGDKINELDVQGVLSHPIIYFLFYRSQLGVIVVVHQYFIDQAYNPLHIGFEQTTRGHGSRTYPHARGYHRGFVIEWYHVFVDGNIRFDQGILG